MERHEETNERLSKLYTSIQEQDQALADIKKHVANLKEQEVRSDDGYLFPTLMLYAQSYCLTILKPVEEEPASKYTRVSQLIC
jgi:hypothetical protein